MTEPHDDGGWHRLHPLSPLLRGGIVVLAVIGYGVSQLFDNVLGSFDPGDVVPGDLPDGGDAGREFSYTTHPVVALALLVLVIAAVAGGSWVSWRFARFRVTARQVELRSGVVFRQHRQVPLERIQAVETTRPLLARLLGLAQVVVQSAGGSDSQLTLAFLDAGRAEEVRAHLLELAGRADEQGAWAGPRDPAAPDASPAAAVRAEDAPPLVTVPNGRLFVATILHGSTIVLGAILLVGLTAVGIAEQGIRVLAGAPALIPVVLGLAVGRVKELLVHGNFSIARTGTSVRVRHGLTDLRTSSVPLHRLQAVEAVQPLWWRPWGWWRVRVNVAGVQGDDSGGDETTLLPVGTLDEALRVLATLGVRPDDPLVLGALQGTGPDVGWVGPPREARLLDPWAWRRIGYALSSGAVHIRSGRWTRHAVFVPYARVQSLTLSRGPLQARLGLASARVVSTPGPVAAVVPHLATADAEAFLAVVGDHAREARRPAPGTSGPAAGARPAVETVDPLAPDAPPLVD